MDWFYMPTKVLFCDNVINENEDLFKAYGVNCLIVTGKTSGYKSGAIKDLEAMFLSQGIKWFVFDEIMENPTFEILQKAKNQYMDKKIDFIVGIGGGSPLDAAKMIGVLLKNEKTKARDLLVDGQLESLPMIAIPTTSGTGSETTPYAIITDHKTKSKINCKPKVFPKLALLDVKYFLSMPDSVIRSTGVDALCHLVEGYLVKASNSFSDQLALSGLGFFVKAMENLKDGNFTLEMHRNLIYASTIAGMVISHTGTGIPHGMGYFLTYNYGTYHGKATALFLPSLLELHITKEHSNRQKGLEVLALLGFENLEAFRNYITSIVGTESITMEEVVEYSEEFSKNERKLNAHDFQITYEDIKKAFIESLDCKSAF